MAPPERHVDRALSSIVLPIEIPTAEITPLVDRVVPEQLYAEERRPIRRGLLRGSVDLDLRRNGPVVVRTHDGLIVTDLPLRADGRVRVARVARPYSTTFTIHAVTDLNLDEEWKTTAHTRGSFSWETEPVISLLGLRFNVSKTAGNALTRQLTRLAPRLDSIIAERVNLRDRVERIWESLSEPMAVREEPPVWLRVEPVDAFFRPALSLDDTLVYGLGVRAYVETVVGARPAVPDLGALPPLAVLPDSLASDTSAFVVNLPVSISYDDANAFLAEAAAGKEFTLQDRVGVAVRSIRVYGSGPELVARVDFRAFVPETFLETQGRVYFTGRPVYDPEAQTVRVDSFSYDVRSELALAETADWFFRDEFLAQTQARLVFPLADRLVEARDLLDEALRERPLGRYIVLHGTVTELATGAIHLTEGGLEADVLARGTLTARLHDLEQLRTRRPAKPVASE